MGPVAYADPTGQTFDEARRHLGPFDAYRSPIRMLEEFRPRFAIVLLEAAHGPQWVLAALRAGCDVLSEKHPAANRRDVEGLFGEAESRGRRLIPAFSNRAHPAAQKARALLASGGMGTLLGASVFIVADQTRLRDPEYQSSWRANRARAGGGILMALGVHSIDLLLYLMGASVDRVVSLCRNAGGAPVDIEDAAALVLQLRNGGLVTLHAGFYLDASYQSRLELWLSNGWLRLEPGGERPLCWQCYDGSDPRSWTCDHGLNGTELFFQQAIDSVRFETGPIELSPDGRHVLETVFAAYESSASGEAVTVGSGVPAGV
jgi:predicted dehydrogenase